MSNTIDDKIVREYVARLQEGDDSAFEPLMELFQRPIFNLVYRMINHYEEAADLSQEIFIKMYKSIDQYQGRAKFSTWFFSVAVNMSLNRRRKLASRKREVYSLDAAGDDEAPDARDAADSRPGPDARARHHEIRERVELAIAGLPVEFRGVVAMRDIQGMSYEEISKAAGCGVGTVKSRLSRGRGILREQLKDLL
ncbi:MAG: sigma-70 family RNA polymerase sigma factor [Verrucomicrobia bacterium]|nr:sigma-70 family RNA polymerase sigma factor [Verrucomicrobiota bacterium]MDA1088373.1 sigma-70 family RNA polymerase sigma factor [Verrucomicrobiota bacterium]